MIPNLILHGSLILFSTDYSYIIWFVINYVVSIQHFQLHFCDAVEITYLFVVFVENNFNLLTNMKLVHAKDLHCGDFKMYKHVVSNY